GAHGLLQSFPATVDDVARGPTGRLRCACGAREAPRKCSNQSVRAGLPLPGNSDSGCSARTPRRRVSWRCSSGFEKEVLMAETVRRVEYYYVTIPDAPGEGGRILSALKDSGVNLLAFLGFPLGGGQSQIDLVPEDPQSLREAAERAGVTLSEAKGAFLIQGDDRVGAVADTAAKLAEANINLTAAAATGAGSG